MMYITMLNPIVHSPTNLNTNRMSEFVELSWHIGTKPNFCLCRENSYLVTEVQADGDELDKIIQVCDNIPIVKGRSVQTWTGDFAKFIINNVVL